MNVVRVGTRGSRLSRAQTDTVTAALSAVHPGLRCQILVLQTTGDRSEAPLRQSGATGWFTSEIERALLERRVDLAVHSLKDLPTAPTPGLVVAAIPPREDPRDALVSQHASLDALPYGARVGTSSPRRAAQLRAVRRDLEVVPLRGNVDTRLRKVRDGEVDAAVLAAAGLLRGGWSEAIAQLLDPEVLLPAAGQGALAVQVREDDVELQALVAALDDPPTRAAVTAERAFLRTLAGGCSLPAGALATVGDELVLRVLVASDDGRRVVRATRSGPVEQASGIGEAAARQVLALAPISKW
ncbi:MAG: hydroxymethylbilane synthase [Armatimonadota bacterium]|nr:hydroxymethylbilane synthase [Armatimonadota bacterium]MDR5697717.1 hydroxymethylbilane synthase [Armatimonadota bacterium]